MPTEAITGGRADLRDVADRPLRVLRRVWRDNREVYGFRKCGTSSSAKGRPSLAVRWRV
jgi:hypothetical protein